MLVFLYRAYEKYDGEKLIGIFYSGEKKSFY